jgi:hypothetical protein
MASGLKVPVGVNRSGGGAIVSGTENDEKVIMLALGDDDNENAFQQNIGVGARMIFDLSDERQRAKIIRRVKDVFIRFEAQKRFILRPNTVKWSRDSDNQDMILEFKYVSLESDEERDFRETFTETQTGVG